MLLHLIWSNAVSLDDISVVEPLHMVMNSIPVLRSGAVNQNFETPAPPIAHELAEWATKLVEQCKITNPTIRAPVVR